MYGMEQEWILINNKDFKPPFMVVIKKYWLFLQDLFAAYRQDQRDLDKKPREGQDFQ